MKRGERADLFEPSGDKEEKKGETTRRGSHHIRGKG